MYVAYLTKLMGKRQKYEVRLFKHHNDELVHISTIKFGASGYGDYTLGTSDEQKKSYIARHERNEDWTKTGYSTAGFWSRWLLWNKRTISESISDIEKRFDDIRIFV